MRSILIVEDDTHLGPTLERGLADEGYATTLVGLPGRAAVGVGAAAVEAGGAPCPIAPGGAATAGRSTTSPRASRTPAARPRCC